MIDQRALLFYHLAVINHGKELIRTEFHGNFSCDLHIILQRIIQYSLSAAGIKQFFHILHTADMAGADNRNRHGSTDFLYDIDIFFMLIIRFGQIKYENTVTLIIAVAHCQGHWIYADLTFILQPVYRPFLI